MSNRRALFRSLFSDDRIKTNLTHNNNCLISYMKDFGFDKKDVFTIQILLETDPNIIEKLLKAKDKDIRIIAHEASQNSILDEESLIVFFNDILDKDIAVNNHRSSTPKNDISDTAQDNSNIDETNTTKDPFKIDYNNPSRCAITEKIKSSTGRQIEPCEKCGTFTYIIGADYYFKGCFTVSNRRLHFILDIDNCSGYKSQKYASRYQREDIIHFLNDDFISAFKKNPVECVIYYLDDYELRAKRKYECEIKSVSDYRSYGSRYFTIDGQGTLHLDDGRILSGYFSDNYFIRGKIVFPSGMSVDVSEYGIDGITFKNGNSLKFNQDSKHPHDHKQSINPHCDSGISFKELIENGFEGVANEYVAYGIKRYKNGDTFEGRFTFNRKSFNKSVCISRGKITWANGEVTEGDVSHYKDMIGKNN